MPNERSIYSVTFVEAEKPRHECGIFGLYYPGEKTAQLTYFGLQGLQHRGQESAGIASLSDSGKIEVRKKMGLVREFQQSDLEGLDGIATIGHTRYSNTGGSNLVNAQPATYEGLAIAENGNLVNPKTLRGKLESQGYSPSFAEDERCSSDGELIAQAIHAAQGRNIVEKIQRASLDFKGAYSLTILSGDSLIGVKDPLGVWPLAVGELNGKGMVLASESSAFGLIGAKYVRELKPGEILVIRDGKQESFFLPETMENSARCIFDINYFLRPDSILPSGEQVAAVRQRLGRNLAKRFPVLGADVVLEVPNSGRFGARGFADESQVPLETGLIKNDYIGRTFISPDQRIRKQGARLKYSILKEAVDGKIIVLVDDSIVRGNTSAQLTRMLFESGAKEVHWRSTFPQVAHTCSYGIDLASRNELISANKSPDEVAKEIEATSAAFNTIEDFLSAARMSTDTACTGCVTGNYPIETPSDRDKFALTSL